MLNQFDSDSGNYNDIVNYDDEKSQVHGMRVQHEPALLLQQRQC